MGLLFRLFFPLYHVGVYEGDECCCCSVMCLLFAPFAVIAAIEGAEDPWYRECAGTGGVRNLVRGDVR